LASGYSAIFANNLHSEPAEAATWLDQAIPAHKKPIIHEKGFGPVVSKAPVAREEWLIANRHASVEQPGTIMPKPDMLRELKKTEASPSPLPRNSECRITRHSKVCA
jgi:hypothetical protein